MQDILHNFSQQQLSIPYFLSLISTYEYGCSGVHTYQPIFLLFAQKSSKQVPAYTGLYMYLLLVNIISDAKVSYYFTSTIELPLTSPFTHAGLPIYNSIENLNLFSLFIAEDGILNCCTNESKTIHLNPFPACFAGIMNCRINACRTNES